jgi:hypothetical protein
MLSKNDKQWIRVTVSEILKEALTVKVRFEKRRNTETGQPLAVPEIEVRDVYLPAHWVEFLPFHEAALRGSQETLDKLKNSDAKQVRGVEVMAGILLSMESGFKAIAEMADRIKLSQPAPAIEIEHKKEGES